LIREHGTLTEGDGSVQQQQNGQTYHGGDGEVPLVHLLGQPVNLPTGVTENDSLGNSQRFVQVAKSVLTSII